MAKKAESKAPANAGAKPATPAAPAAKPADDTKLTFADLEAMDTATQIEYSKTIVSTNKAVEKAKTKFTEKLQFYAKVVAALKRSYTTALNARQVPPDTSFKKYFEQNAGGALPGRVEALASVFNSLVLTLDSNGKPLLSEENFDLAAVDWLEKANAFVAAAQKKHGDNWKTCDEVLDTINALSKPGEAGKKLKEIRERQKVEAEPGEPGEPGEAGDGDENIEKVQAVPLTVGRCVEFLKAAILGASGMPEESARVLFCDVCVLADSWEKSGIAEHKLLAWAKQHVQGVAPQIQVVKAPEPAAQAA
ncbi:MAG: hypothetical protein ACTHKU_10375 [Verrucomicrobiota bacterium]